MAFSGTTEKCRSCDKTVHFIEMVSVDGVPYHKTCFRCSHCKGLLVTSQMDWAPSKVASLFSGTQDKCGVCKKTCYPLEKVTVEGEIYHKNCFRCAHGGCFLTTSSYAALDGFLYCKHHFAQLFKEKGSYSHLTKTSSMKRSPSGGKFDAESDSEPKLEDNKTGTEAQPDQ
ncbi:hypothetical protein GOBAR_AA27648 [Gossypium barbadense]|uniref:LIM zinc-binding domain-containing protein n=1 Tax=Gossypium barbadense TaxID=3634 RepID=A0A2P5WPL2_GOSBA|nr:hypothetical protein GOBAR_AA27648 [Gossypium barbadense]